MEDTLVFYRAAILVRHENLEHKSIAPITGQKETINACLPKIQDFLEKNKQMYKSQFPDISSRIKYSGKYKLQLLSEEKTAKFDKITLDFLEFLKEINVLTPGTDETLPPWVINLTNEKEKEERKQLHYTYGTANAPPLQSHHVTIDYNNEEPDGQIECPHRIIDCIGIVIYTTNLKGELLEKVWGTYF